MTQQSYECSKCKETFNNKQVKYEKVPSNMSFGPGPVITDKGIPKCPHCGELSFFGFKVIDIAH